MSRYSCPHCGSKEVYDSLSIPDCCECEHCGEVFHEEDASIKAQRRKNKRPVGVGEDNDEWE